MAPSYLGCTRPSRWNHAHRPRQSARRRRHCPPVFIDGFPPDSVRLGVYAGSWSLARSFRTTASFLLFTLAPFLRYGCAWRSVVGRLPRELGQQAASLCLARRVITVVVRVRYREVRQTIHWALSNLASNPTCRASRLAYLYHGGRPAPARPRRKTAVLSHVASATTSLPIVLRFNYCGPISPSYPFLQPKWVGSCVFSSFLLRNEVGSRKEGLCCGADFTLT